MSIRSLRCPHQLSAGNKKAPREVLYLNLVFWVLAKSDNLLISKVCFLQVHLLLLLLRCPYDLKKALSGHDLDYLHLFSGLFNCSRNHSDPSCRLSLVYTIARTPSEAPSYSLNLFKTKS